MGSGANPPPLEALQCPSPLGHSGLHVRENHFYCETCEERYNTVWNDRDNAPITHSAYVAARDQARA